MSLFRLLPGHISASMNRWIRLFAQLFKSIQSFLYGYSYTCKHLNGLENNTEMGIAINSDLSISCNPYDMYGNGKLGNIKSNKLEKILNGEKANYFRKSLLKGFLPIPECFNCPGLKRITNKDEKYERFNGNLPTVMIENTAKCNVACLSCDRQAVKANREKNTIIPNDITLLYNELIKYNLKNIILLNIGEPFASNNILQIINLAKKNFPNAKITSSTNGSLLNNDLKRQAALKLDTLYFTLPGTDQISIEKYQVGQNFNAAYQNLKDLIDMKNKNHVRRPEIIWKYLIFNWNDSDKEIAKAMKMAKTAGVDQILFVKCISPIFGMSLKYLLGKKLPTEKSAKLVYVNRHPDEDLAHNHMALIFKTTEISEQKGIIDAY